MAILHAPVRNPGSLSKGWGGGWDVTASGTQCGAKIGTGDHFHDASHFYTRIRESLESAQVTGMDTNTNCIVCGREAGYHRAVVDVVAESVVGGLCRECEREEFGRTLDRGFFETRDGCMFCERDGHVAIPVWRPVAEQTPSGTVVTEVTYTVDDATARLCDEHVSTISGAYPASRPQLVPSK